MPVPELLRLALDEALESGADSNSPLVRSLLATVANRPAVLAEASAYVSGELEEARSAVAVLHLDGPTVVHHKTSADRFAAFVQHLARSVKEVAKTQMGRERLATRLLIAPVFEGSIGVRLEVPYDGDPVGTDELLHASTAESDALRFVAALLTQSSVDDVGDEEIGGHVQGMSAAARTQLRLAAKQQASAGWVVSGEVIERGRDAIAVHSTERGVNRLIAELDRHTVETKDFIRTGTIDGVKHSLRAVYFIDDDGSRFTLAAPELTVLMDAAAMTTAPEDRVQIEFVLTTTAAPGDSSGKLQRSRRLTAVTRLAAAPITPNDPLL